MIDIVRHLEKFETENNISLKPLVNFQIEIVPLPGNVVPFEAKETLKYKKDYFMKAAKIRRSRLELQKLQALDHPKHHQFVVRDKLRIFILEDDECIWNHTSQKSCKGRKELNLIEKCFICIRREQPC